MDYRIAIPTIKRSETIRKKTLNYLFIKNLFNK